MMTSKGNEAIMRRIGTPEWMSRVAIVGCGPEQRLRDVCGAVANGCGAAVREADAAYGTGPTVRAESLCRSGCVKLDYMG
jgi:hypothetical protein